MRPQEQVALVAGGASGLGRATSEALLAHDARVIVLDLPDALRHCPEGAWQCPGDVTHTDQVADAVRIAEQLGGLRICVNCAGIAPVGATLTAGEPLRLEEFRRVVEVNLIGTFNVARLAAAAIARLKPIDGERGLIVNTASIAAYEGQVGQVAYAASKAGVAGTTLPMARDLAASLIRCISIAPGLFDTPLLADVPEHIRARIVASVPHPSRLGNPAEFAALVLHVISNQMLNGEVIRVDAGLRLAAR